MKTGQDITHVRGDDLAISVTVTLDNSRSLDGTEAWRWVLRANPEQHALVSKTSVSGIALDGSTHQPTITIGSADFPLSEFPSSIADRIYMHELQMTKSGSVETILRGSFTLVSDIA